MSSRARGHPRSNRGRPANRSRKSQPRSPATVWLCGRHAVRAALQNPDRCIRRVLVAREAGDGLARACAHLLRKRGAALSPEDCARQTIDQLFVAGTVHQGLALETELLPSANLTRLCGEAGSGSIAVCLDRVTDPQNVGAVLRSAGAFGAAFLVLPERHAPGETAALAKAASGALETVPVVRARNLSQALRAMRESGFVCLGLDPTGPEPLVAAIGRIGGRRPVALVLGAEGRGLGPGTRTHCDALVSIAIVAAQGSLNVAATSAIALYEAGRQRGRTGAGSSRNP